jgi:hypothetical protein
MREESRLLRWVSYVALGTVGWRKTYCRLRINILLGFLDVHEIVASERNDGRKWIF